ncbi:hypothetical protein [Azohydromonas caseinilytica]|uniref:Uncharacterized protein n=1 Tax=Azohydromonas caseinilytica TaxID=2728836 RepID=A0A848FC68_9BURK|nr:hypothetical protein [Azohydromonas caseinilytica]NML15780.1 hypothetical protein [Azohydromonas caseinilytica]
MNHEISNNHTAGTAQIIEGVIEAVQRAFFDLDTWSDEEMHSSGRFSARVFPQFRHLAEKLQCDVRFTASEPRNYEFLYDICLLKTSGAFNERNGYFYTHSPLRRALLVLECEWSPREEEIVYDFSKLLLARADLRCMIFYRSSRPLVDACIERARFAIKSFEQSTTSDRYLLCGLHGRSTTFTMLDGLGNDLEIGDFQRSIQKQARPHIQNL